MEYIAVDWMVIYRHYGLATQMLSIVFKNFLMLLKPLLALLREFFCSFKYYLNEESSIVYEYEYLKYENSVHVVKTCEKDNKYFETVCFSKLYRIRNHVQIKYFI